MAMIMKIKGGIVQAAGICHVSLQFSQLGGHVLHQL